VFTILASIVRDAECVAFEPLPETFSYLEENIRLNGSPSRAELLNQGVGRQASTLRFTSNEGATNHALAQDEESDSAIELPVVTLDDVSQTRRRPTVLKVDVEGFEHDVLAGAKNLLEDPSLNAVMLELRGHGARYGFDEDEIHTRVLDLGFVPKIYDPFERRFLDWKRESDTKLGDVLYLRDVAKAEARVAESRTFRVKGFDL
jgi:FkbM family methyltransferase